MKHLAMTKIKPEDVETVETTREQLERWLRGENVHARGHRRGETYTCCPDFSCCMPELAQPRDVRSSYARAEPKEQDAMLMTFLGLMLNRVTSKRVLITNGERRIMTHAPGPRSRTS